MANELEPNNTFSSADLLNRNETTIGNLSGTSDIDYYRVSVPIASELNISFGAPDGGNSFINEWDVVLYNSSGEVINARSLVENKGHIFSSYVQSGTYYIAVKQQNSYDLSSENYQISYNVVYGNYNTGYEPNEDTSSNSQITLGEEIFGNLYATNDKDVYYFFLPSGRDTIKVDFVIGSSDGSNFTKEWDVVLYDSNLNRLDGKAFVNNGFFEVSTKSTGKFYIQVDQGNSYNLNQNNYYMTVTSSTTSGSSSNSSSGSSSSSSSTSILHLTGEGDDGLTVGSSGDDLYEVSKGRDDYDGNGGYDTLYDIPRGSIIVRGQDVNGNYTGVINKKFIYIKEKKPDETFDDSYTIAWEAEGIQYEDSDITYNISSFNSTSYFPLGSSDFSDQNLNNNQSVTVEMASNFFASNEGSSTTFTFSSSNSALTDQISQSGNSLTIKSGSKGPKETATITVTASETSINRSSPQTKTETFTVTMTDDDYSGSSREREPNDLYDQAITLDPNFDTQKFTSATYSSDNIITANLSSKGDYDRYWINLDQNETIKIKFDQVYNTGTEKSYKIYFVRESTGDVFKTSITEAGYIYTIPFRAPSEGVYHVVVTANSGEKSYESRDYEISIDSFDNPTTQSSSNFLDLNYDYDSYSDPIKGTSASETISGTPQSGTIDSFEGNDIINAGKGADIIDGGEGNDTINAGDGRDDIYVSNGIDLINGGPGIDTLTIPDDSWTVIHSIDRQGRFFSKDTEYLYVKSEDGNSVTRAANIEKISIYKLDSDGNQVWGNTNSTDSTFSVRVFDYSTNYWYLKKLDTIADKNIPYKGFATVDASNVSINLDDYFASENYGYDVKYSITSPTSTNYLSISGDILTINARNDVNDTVPVTISARNLKPDGSTISNDEPLEQTFYITFAPDIIGDDGDNEIDGTSGDDIYNVTDGFDVVDGKSGSDTIVIPYRDDSQEFWDTLATDKDSRGYNENISNYSISKTIDIDGSLTGTVGQEFLYITKFLESKSFLTNGFFLDENILLTTPGEKWLNTTIAINFEKIYFENKLYNYEDFQANSYWSLNSVPSENNNILQEGDPLSRPKNIDNQSLLYGETEVINLDNFYINANPNLDIIYTLVSVDNEKLKDQINLDDSIITLTSGENGPQETSFVTIKGYFEYDASEIIHTRDYWEFYSIGGSDNPNNDRIQANSTLTFKVTMSDDDAFKGNDIIIPNGSPSQIENYSNGYYDAENGDDIYILSMDIIDNADFKISDTLGNNKIELVDGFSFISSRFSSNSFELTLTDNRKITIDNSKSFSYDIGGNASAGVKGSSLSYSEFASALGVDEIPNNSSFVDGFSGNVSDKRIISDGSLTYSLDSSPANNVEEGALITFTVKSSSNVSEDINLTWEVASAKNFNSLDETSDNDINPVSGTITILSGSSSSSFEVKINSDNLLENDESFKINISDSNSKIIASDIIIVRDVNNLGYELSVEKNENGPDILEFSDTFNNRGTLNHTVNNEIIVLTGQAGTIRGLKGDDVYLVSNLITSGAKIQITDTDGNNTIEIPDNTLITKALFASNATKLTLGNNQEITITSADKFTYNVSGNISNGDIGKSLTYNEFANIFGIELSDETQTVEKNYYMKSDAVNASIFNIINISGTDDATIFATNDDDEFRYEVNNDGTSDEGPYSFEIEGFDKTNDKLVLVNKTGSAILTTQEFDAKDNVEVTSDGIVGTQILFAPDSSGQSGKLTINGIDEQFSNNWTAESYKVEIKPESQLISSNSLSETSYTFSDTQNLSKSVLSEFNSSISNGVLNYSDQNDIIILNGSGKTAAGKSGNDLYIISDLIPKNGKIQITDTEGSNIIQIPDNTYIDETLFTKNATRLTLKDGREITVSDADEFTYNLGANITTGDKSVDLNYSEFASAFGVEDVLSLNSSVNGTIVDQYII